MATMTTRTDMEEVFSGNESYQESNGQFNIMTTVFESTVAFDEDSSKYTVTTRVPSLEAATEDAVGPTVQQDWRETFERRLEDAPKATRLKVDLEEHGVSEADGSITVRFEFSSERPGNAAEIAKALVEYVEGTYVEGIIPGYEYIEPVSDLLSDASQGDGTGTPL